MLMEYVTSNRELMSKAFDMMPDTIKGSNFKKSHFQMITPLDH